MDYKFFQSVLIVSLSALVVSFIGSVNAGDDTIKIIAPKIECNDNMRILLPDKMIKALNSLDHSFKIRPIDSYPDWYLKQYSCSENSTPFAVVGDFNGDGKKDATLDGLSDQSYKRIVLLSDENDYSPLIIYEKENIPENLLKEFAVYYVPPGTYMSPNDEKVLETKNDSIGVILINKGISSIYYYDHGLFKSFLVAD